MIQHRLIQGSGVSPVISASLVWSSTKTDQKVICFTSVSVSLSMSRHEKHQRAFIPSLSSHVFSSIFSLIDAKGKSTMPSWLSAFQSKKQKTMLVVAVSLGLLPFRNIYNLQGFFFYVSNSFLSSYRLRPWLAVDLNMEMKIWNRGEGACCWSHMWRSSSHKKNPTQVPSGSISQSAQIRPKGVCRNSAAALC